MAITDQIRGPDDEQARHRQAPKTGTTVDGYRDEIAAAHRPVFDRIHRLIVDTCPDAEVALSYGVPTYRLGRRRLNVGAWRHGISLYVSPSRDGGFSARHPELAAGKGTLKLRAEDAARIPDAEFADLIRAALDV